jgi:hypothetical protein
VDDSSGPPAIEAEKMEKAQCPKAGKNCSRADPLGLKSPLELIPSLGNYLQHNRKKCKM